MSTNGKEFLYFLSARDMWKKKYFQEKKKTSPLEDRVAQLKTDVDFHHGKTVQIIENESKHATQVGAVKEAELGVRDAKFNQ